MLKPLGARVLIRPSEAEEKSAGGIVLPDTARRRPQEGKVLALGSGHEMKDGTRAPLSVKVGDIVIYSRYASTQVRVNGEDLMLLEEDSILAIKE